MAVKIRLKRMGMKKRPFYRVVVSDQRSPRDGRFIEEIGYYNPMTVVKDENGVGAARQKPPNILRIRAPLPPRI